MADFEKSIVQLESIITKLNGGELSLDESIALYEKGMKLTGELEKLLDANQKRVTLVMEGKEVPFDNSKQEEKSQQISLMNKE